MYFKGEAFPGPVPDVDALDVLDAYFAWRRTHSHAELEPDPSRRSALPGI